MKISDAPLSVASFNIFLTSILVSPIKFSVSFSLESCVGIELPLFYFIKSIPPVDRIVDIKKLYSESLRITYRYR